jgi:hypothetical protein
MNHFDENCLPSRIAITLERSQVSRAGSASSQAGIITWPATAASTPKKAHEKSPTDGRALSASTRGARGYFAAAVLFT